MKKEKLPVDFKPFGNQFRAIRIERGLSQEDAAQELGLTMRYYQKLEKGIVKPSLSTFARMVQFYNISVDEMFHLDLEIKKSTLRLQVDNVVDQLEEPGLIVMISTGEGLIKANKYFLNKAEEK